MYMFYNVAQMTHWRLLAVSCLWSISSHSAYAGEAQLLNPLAFDSITDLLEAILNVLIVLAVPIIVFFIIYAGFLYVTARGNAQQIQDATRALTYAVIGGVLIIGALAIATIIGNIVNEFRTD
jgi:formate-dependent nitrite reductase membrane component NrfD